MQLQRLKNINSAVVIGVVLAVCSGCGSSIIAPAIVTQPLSQAIVVGQSVTFSVSMTGSHLNYQWQNGATIIPGAIASSYTISAAAASDSGSQFSVIVGNDVATVTSSVATLTVFPATDVLTYHNDIGRTGQNLTESLLTTGNVSPATFGKLAYFPSDGLVDAQPLFTSNVTVPGNGTHNLLIVASEHDSVFAYDVDSSTTIWRVSLLKSGEAPSDDRSCPNLTPEIGITATPVIDRTRGPNGAVYVVAMSKDGSTYHQRLHALDLALGTELFGGPVEIQASYPGTGDNSDGTNVIFDPGQYMDRASLLLLNGVVYTAWASHCDVRPYTGWVIGYDASSLAPAGVINVIPNSSGGAIWMAGAGLAADNSGNIYFLDANGGFDSTLDANGFPGDRDFGNAFIKLSTSGNQLTVADYFAMYDQQQETASDTDLGSGGVMVVPDQTDVTGNTVHLAVGAGKDSNLYVVNRDNMGKYRDSDNDDLYQELPGVFPYGVWSSPAYFNNTIYYGSVGNTIQAFSINNGQLSTSATARSAVSLGYPGATPGISANGTSNGIVWAVENNVPAVLHAYNATNLNEIYNSSQAAAGRDNPGAGNKFITPIIVNGKVFVATPNGVAMFGLLK